MTISKSVQLNYPPHWKVPTMDILLWAGKSHEHSVVIPVINEGERILNLLKRMKDCSVSEIADIIIIDGGSTDGSLQLDALRSHGVRGLIVKTGPGKLSAQLRCAYAFSLINNYKGIVTIDGNNKDDPSSIIDFIDSLNCGIDFVQASRFLPGGVAENTPRLREFAIRCIHAPFLSLASGFKWTDTTQGFRAYSRRFLLDDKVAPFRDIFSAYELLAYLSKIAPKYGYACKEIPTTRSYPVGVTPTKIRGIRANFDIFKVLVKTCLGHYDASEK